MAVSKKYLTNLGATHNAVNFKDEWQMMETGQAKDNELIL